MVGNNSKPVLFADDTGLIVTHSNHIDFNKEITSVFIQLNKWFAAKLLYLNLKKLNMCSLWQNTSVDEISIGYNNMFIANTSNTKFLGLVITNSLSGKDHITELTPKLCKTCYVLTCTRPLISQDTLKSVYYSYFHSLLVTG